MARLFIGLWPDDGVRAALADHQAGWRWPPRAARVARERLHLTLHFLGPVARDRLPALEQALGTVPPARFALRWDGTEVWPGGIAVLRPAPHPALLALHAALGDRLCALGLPLERRAFRPHLTVARKADGAEAAPPPAGDWAVQGFVLVESLPAGAGYRVAWRSG